LKPLRNTGSASDVANPVRKTDPRFFICNRFNGMDGSRPAIGLDQAALASPVMRQLRFNSEDRPALHGDHETIGGFVNYNAPTPFAKSTRMKAVQMINSSTGGGGLINRLCKKVKALSEAFQDEMQHRSSPKTVPLSAKGEELIAKRTDDRFRTLGAKVPCFEW